MSQSADPLESIQRKIGYRFKNVALLQQALCHSSYGYEHQTPHNERLEFLGDSVLGYLVARKIFHLLPDAREGDLSKHKSALVSTLMLAEKGRQLGLGHFLKLGAGELKTGGRQKESILADSVESLIAAVTLDGGLKAAERLIKRLYHLEFKVPDLSLKNAQDFKTLLQERLQALGLGLPEYRVLSEQGPAHRRKFEVQVFVGQDAGPHALGSSKKNAQQACAKALLEDADFWTQVTVPGDAMRPDQNETG